MATTATCEQLALHGGAPLAPDLKAPPWPPVTESAENALIEVYRSRSWSFMGEHEMAFARDFAAAHDAKHGILMANGTLTLEAALSAHSIGAGDEVIVPALTWPATAMAAICLGAKPIFVDIEASTLCMDPRAFEAAITGKTKAVIPVHLFGSMADMEAILEIARRHNIVVIEDCAHAHGGKWDGRGLGSWGDVGSFSFQQSKTMASGEGGLCTANDTDVAERLFRMKHIGYADGSRQGVYTSGPPQGLPVQNFRATEFQAVLLQDQLNTLDEQIETYNRNAARLEERIADAPGFRVQSRGRLSTRQSYYAFCVIADEEPLRDVPLETVIAALNAEGLPVSKTYGVVYQHTLFNQPETAFAIAAGGCRVAEEIGVEGAMVLLHHWLGADDATIETMGDIFCKVAANSDALKA